MESRFIKKKMFWLCEPFGGHVLRWSGIGHEPSLFFVAQSDLRSRYVRSELFLVYGCRLLCFFVLFYFLQQTFILILFYPISKMIFHIGDLVSKMHISIYMLLTEWKCFCFFSFIASILGL